MISYADRNNAYARCLGCNRRLDMSVDSAIIGTQGIAGLLRSVNCSYILPSGIVVLVDEDIEDYFNGTLIFYDPADLPVLVAS